MHNAVYESQIRGYELRLGADDVDQTSRVRTKAGNVANFQLCNPLLPWEMRRSDAQITNAEVAAILDGLQQDVKDAPALAGQRLRSNKFY